MDEDNPAITMDNNTIVFEGCRHILGEYRRLELNYDQRNPDGFYNGPNIYIATYNIDEVFTVDMLKKDLYMKLIKHLILHIRVRTYGGFAYCKYTFFIENTKDSKDLIKGLLQILNYILKLDILQKIYYKIC